MKFRFALCYAAIFAIVGIHQPYWPLWLHYKELGSFEIAVLTALTFTLKIVATPVAARIADNSGRKKMILILLAAGMSLGSAAFLAANSFTPILVVTLFTFACWSPLMSLLDSVTTLQAKASGFDYGRIRLWGSVAMLAVTVSAGRLIGTVGPSVILPALTLACIFLLCAAFLLPAENRSKGRKNSDGTWRFFVSSDWFPLFIVSTMLIQGSHAALYAFGSLSWKANGISDSAIGALWAASIVVEAVFFAVGRPMLARFSGSSVIAFGGMFAVLRWLLLAGFPGNVLVAALSQTLHGVTFSASHLAAMQLISEHVESQYSASAQGLYSSIIMGAGMGVFIFMCGPLYPLLGSHIFTLMAAIAALGTTLAILLKRRTFTLIGDGFQANAPGHE